MARYFVTLVVVLCTTVAAIGQEVSGISNKVYLEVGTVEPANPVITWITPNQEITIIDDKTGIIKVGVNSEIALKNVTLYINNLPTQNDRGLGVVSTEDADFDEIFKKSIQLNEGDNVIKIVAENIKGDVTIEQRIITVNPPVLATRTDYALLFAIDEYDSWPDLVNPVNDATAIGKELEDFYGFNVDLVINPTKKGILDKLLEYAKKSYLEHDQLFIFFAGHGQFDPFFSQGYLVCKDSDKNDEVKLGYFSHANLREIVNNIPSKHTFLAIDACFGGTIDPLIARAGDRGLDDMYNELTQTEYIQRKLRFKTRKYLTSGGKEYVPDGRPGRHSPFAAKILEALRNYGGRDKIITLPELMGYLDKINPEPRTGGFGDNEPGSDFVFVVK